MGSLWEQYFQCSWSYTQKTIGSWSITSYLCFCLYLLEHKSLRALSHSCSLDLSCKHSYNWLADSGRLRVFDLLDSLQKVEAVHRERLFSPNLSYFIAAPLVTSCWLTKCTIVSWTTTKDTCWQRKTYLPSMRFKWPKFYSRLFIKGCLVKFSQDIGVCHTDDLWYRYFDICVHSFL